MKSKVDTKTSEGKVYSRVPSGELVDMRLHDLKNYINSAYCFSEDLSQSKAQRKMRDTYGRAMQILSTELPRELMGGNESSRKSFVSVLLKMIKSAEGPLLSIKEHHSQQKHYLERVIQNHNLLSNKLEMIYSEHSKENIYNIAVSVCDQIEERSYDLNKKVNIVPRFSEKLKNIRGDVDDFANLFSISINNSEEASKKRGKVEVIGDIEDGLLKLIVRDYGKGIPPHVLEKLKDPSEVGVTYGKKNGSGVGIPILRKTLEKYNGSMDIISESGFTEVSMSIPLANLGYSDVGNITLN